MVNTSRLTGRGLAAAIVMTLATAVASHLVGHGRAVPHDFTDVLRLGYYAAAGLAVAAAFANFVLLPTRTGEQRSVTRRLRILTAVTAVLVCVLGADFAAGLSSDYPLGIYTSRGAYTFLSAPALHPPVLKADVTQPGRLANGYFFTTNLYDPSNPAMMVGQSGPLILDQRLSPIWFRPVPENDLAGNLSLQTFDGQPVLAWWQGHIDSAGATRTGEYVVVDRHYQVVARLRGADGWVLTLHEIVIRGDDAWVTASKNVPVSLSQYDGAPGGRVLDSAVQEYNLKTGALLRSWDAMDHIPLSQSWAPVSSNAPWDAYHVNSIEVLGDNSFVVSMRNTSAAYKVNIATGRIEWTLGGKQSSFRFGPGAEFEWQHNVVVYPGTPFVTVFDDHCCQVTNEGDIVPPTGPSRGLVLKLSRANATATVAAQYTRPARFGTEYMGNIEPLPGGNELVGWGSQGRFSEYTASGRMLLDAVFPSPDITYRATVAAWTGLPLYPPTGAARPAHGRTLVYASWNGATQVTTWRVLAGSSSGALVPAVTAAKDGFETQIALPPSYRRFQVQALDARGQVLGTSAAFAIDG